MYRTPETRAYYDPSACRTLPFLDCSKPHNAEMNALRPYRLHLAAGFGGGLMLIVLLALAVSPAQPEPPAERVSWTPPPPSAEQIAQARLEQATRERLAAEQAAREEAYAAANPRPTPAWQKGRPSTAVSPTTWTSRRDIPPSKSGRPNADLVWRFFVAHLERQPASPPSADFPGLAEMLRLNGHSATENGPGDFTFVAWFTYQNAFGGTVRDRFRARVKFDDAQSSLSVKSFEAL